MNSWPNFSGPELCGLEAHQVVKILKAGQVSPADLLEAAVQRISQTGPVINATPTLCAAPRTQGRFGSPRERPCRLVGGSAHFH